MDEIENDQAGSYQGQDFELRLGMYLFLNAMKEHEKDNNYAFDIGVQFKPAGKFDDVVLQFRRGLNDPHEYYFVQAKHGKVDDEQSPQKLTTGKIMQVKGDFSLLMYANSYLEMKNNLQFQNPQIAGVILATNRQLESNTIKTMGLQEIKRNDISIDLGPSAQLFQILPSCHSQIASELKIMLEKERKRKNSTNQKPIYPALEGNDVEEKLREYLQKLYLAVNLPNENKFQEIIKKQLLEREFSLVEDDFVFTQFQERMSSVRKEKLFKFLNYQNGIEIFKTIQQKFRSLFLTLNGRLSSILNSNKPQIRFKNQALESIVSNFRHFLNDADVPKLTSLEEPKKPVGKIAHFITEQTVELNFLRFRQALQVEGAAGSFYETKGSHFFETTTGLLKKPREIVTGFRSRDSHHFLVLLWDMKNDKELSLVIGQLLLVVAKDSNKRLVFVSEKQFSPQVELSLQELPAFFVCNVKLSDDDQLCQEILEEYKNLEETKKSWFDNLLSRTSENLEVVKVERVKDAVDLTDESCTEILQTPVNFQGKLHLLKEFLNDSSSNQLNEVLTEEALTQLIQQDAICIGSDPPRLSDLYSARFKPQTEISTECLNHLATNNSNYLVFHGISPADLSWSCSSIPIKKIEILKENDVSSLNTPPRFVILDGNHPENQFKHLCQILDKICSQECGGTPTKREVSMTRVIYLMSKNPNGFKCTQMYSPDFYISRRFHPLTVPFHNLRDTLRRDINTEVPSVYKRHSFVFSPTTEPELVGDHGVHLEAVNHNHKYLIEGSESYYYEDEMDASEKYTQLSCDDTVPGVHWFKVELNSQLITWHRSRGDVNNVSSLYEQKIHAVDPLDEKCFVNRERRVVVLADEPGMGKSTTLSKIGEFVKLGDSIMWTIKIDLNQHQSVINSSEVGFGVDFMMDLLSNIDSSFKDSLTRSLFRHQLKKENQVWFLFDGFDEVKSEFQETVLEFLKFIVTKTGAICWVTTRQHDQQKLEEKLFVPAHSFVPLTEEEPIEFLCRFWWTTIKLKVDGELQLGALEECARQCMNLFEESIQDGQKSFVSIPLRARMLAEVFQHQVLQILTSGNPVVGGSKLFQFDKKFCLSDLYENFIDIKYNIYLKEKLVMGESLHELENKILRDSYNKWHCQLAFKQLFGTNIADLTMADDDGDELSLDILLRIGLIRGTQQSPTFVHRTFAEYFVALYFDQKLRSKSMKNEMRKKWLNFILSKAFDWNWKVVRAFMNDNLLRMPCLLDKASKVARHWQENIKKLLILQKQIFVVIHENLIGLLDFLLENTHDQSTMKACVNVSEHDGSTPLHEATTSGYHEIVKILVEKGAEINTKNSSGDTPLYLATRRGHHEIVKILVEKGAEINTRNWMGLTPLHLAAEKGHHEIVNILIEKGAEINAKDNVSQTPLHLAAKEGHHEIVKILVEKGAEINADDIFGVNPLYLAVEKGHNEIVKFFVEKGAEINAKGMWGRTPLYLAEELGHLEIVKILVEKGAEINSDDISGENPYFMAVHRGHNDKFFVEKVAEINTKGMWGRPSFYLSKEPGHLESVKILVEKRAEVNAEDSTGPTPEIST